jgi:ketosteroid isomerase-like protein
VTTPERRVELAREGVDAYLAGDLDRVVAMMSPDVCVVAAPGLPESGQYRGREEFLDWTARWLDAWQEFDMAVQSIEPVGKRHVVAAVRQSGRGRGSGIDVEMDTGHVYGFDGEVLTYFALFPDAKKALADAQARERDAAHPAAQRQSLAD